MSDTSPRPTYVATSKKDPRCSVCLTPPAMHRKTADGKLECPKRDQRHRWKAGR